MGERGEVTFAERVGGVLVRPRATLAAAVEGGHGAADVALLLVLKVLASETVALARAVMEVPLVGPSALLRGVAHAVGSAAFDVAAIAVAAIVMRLLAGPEKTDLRGELPRRGRAGSELDLAAYAWVPWLAVSLAVWLADTALGRSPGAVEANAARGIAACWAGAVWVLGLLALRSSTGTGTGTGTGAGTGTGTESGS